MLHISDHLFILKHPTLRHASSDILFLTLPLNSRLVMVLFIFFLSILTLVSSFKMFYFLRPLLLSTNCLTTLTLHKILTHFFIVSSPKSVLVKFPLMMRERMKKIPNFFCSFFDVLFFSLKNVLKKFMNKKSWFVYFLCFLHISTLCMFMFSIVYVYVQHVCLCSTCLFMLWLVCICCILLYLLL